MAARTGLERMFLVTDSEAPSLRGFVTEAPHPDSPGFSLFAVGMGYAINAGQSTIATGCASLWQPNGAPAPGNDPTSGGRVAVPKHAGRYDSEELGACLSNIVAHWDDLAPNVGRDVIYLAANPNVRYADLIATVDAQVNVHFGRFRFALPK